MTKRQSEAALGLALRNVDLELYVYKPSDAEMNMKPCDFMVWLSHGHENDRAWFEVKDVTSRDRFSFREVRASQWNAVRRAAKLGIPYWFAIYWRRLGKWTISDAAKILEWREGEGAITGKPAPWIHVISLSSRFGIDSEPGMLVPTLKGVLLGEV